MTEDRGSARARAPRKAAHTLTVGAVTAVRRRRVGDVAALDGQAALEPHHLHRHDSFHCAALPVHAVLLSDAVPSKALGEEILHPRRCGVVGRWLTLRPTAPREGGRTSTRPAPAIVCGESALLPMTSGRCCVSTGRTIPGEPYRCGRTTRFIRRVDDMPAGLGDHPVMPTTSPATRGRRLVRRTLLVFAATVAVAGGAFAVAATDAHDHGFGSPDETVRNFLLATAVDGN